MVLINIADLLRVIVILVLLSPSVVLGQSTIQKLIDSDNYLYPQGIVSTYDSGYVFCGYGHLDGFSSSYDCFVVKTDRHGDTLWMAAFGTPSPSHDYLFDIVQTATGEIVCAGTRGANAYVVMFSENGTLLWERRFSGSGTIWVNSITTTNDNGFVLAGTVGVGSSTDAVIFRLDDFGMLNWARSFKGYNETQGWDAISTMDHGCILVGNAVEQIGTDIVRGILIVKTDEFGDTLWSRYYGKPSFNHWAKYVAEDQYGNIIISGNTNEVIPGGGQVFVMKLNPIGDTLWTRFLTANDADYATDMHVERDGNYVIAGTTEPFVSSSNADLFALEMTPNGDTTFTRKFGYPGIEQFASLTKSYWGEFGIVTPTTSFQSGVHDWDALLTITDTLMLSTCENRATNFNVFGRDFIIGRGYDIVAEPVQLTVSTLFYQPMISDSTICQNTIVLEVNHIPDDGPDIVAYPNPTNGHVWIDAEGIELTEIFSSAGALLFRSNDSHINLTQFPAGLYFMNVHTNDASRVVKVVLE